MINIDKIIAKIKNYEYISFDIYDTLLKRDVCNYRQVFALAEKIVQKQYGLETNFYNLRIEAEARARKKYSGREITFDQIYKNLIGISDNTKEILKILEQTLEQEIVIANSPIKRVYDYCVKNNKKIIIISDMYYDAEFLHLVLEKNSFTNIYRLYVSSEMKTQKRTGKIFLDVLNDLKIQRKDIIHLGDSWKSDVFMPRKIGIAAIHVPTDYETDKWNTYALLNKFIRNRIDRIEDKRQQYGYSLFGPLLCGFIQFIIEQSRQQRVEKILFCSRDGYIMQKAYEKFQANHLTNIPSIYFYGSRRSLQVPLLGISEDSFKEFFKIASFAPYISREKVLSRMGYDVSESISGDAIPLSVIKRDFLDSSKMNSEKEMILKQSKNEKSNLMQYLKNVEVSQGGKYAFVDIGWKCSLQKALTDILDREKIKSEFIGFYLGVHRETKIPEKNRKGFLFDTISDKKNYYSVMGAMSVIEIFFSAPHGSVKYYDKEGVVFYKNEYEDKKKYKYEIEFIEALQVGALTFIEDILKSPIFYELKLDSESAFRNLRTLMTMPESEDIDYFGKFRFDGADGIQPILIWKDWKTYLTNPKQIMIDFSQSGWKIAYIKKIFKISGLEYPLFKSFYKMFKRL